MSAVDWVLLAIVGVSALLGLMRGLVGALASLAAWVLAAWATFHFGAQAGLLLAADGEPGAGQLFAGYALCFLGVLLVVGLVGWLVRRLVHSVGLSGLDRVLGLLLGVARGAFIGCALVLLLALTELPRESQWRASPVVPVFVPGAQWMRAWLPDWVAGRVDFRGESDAPALVSRDAIPATAAGLPDPIDIPLEAAAAMIEEMQPAGQSSQEVPQSSQQQPQTKPGS